LTIDVDAGRRQGSVWIRILWFAAIWAASVFAFGLIAYGIRLALH